MSTDLSVILCVGRAKSHLTDAPVSANILLYPARGCGCADHEGAEEQMGQHGIKDEPDTVPRCPEQVE